MKKNLGLYLHIPFCRKKCGYCDFLSWAGTDEEIELYIQALEKEIRSYKEFAADYRIDTIFMGGGTPSCLTREQLKTVWDAVFETFVVERDAEITMEMNPGTAEPDKLEYCRACGVNRLSIGLQSVNDDNLKLLGRIHTYEEFLESYRMVREAGFDNVNLDLISALPGQTIEEWKQELQTAADLKPEHLSVYQLILEEGTPFYETYYEHPELLPDEETSRLIFTETDKILGSHGYDAYEISNYAKPGKESRHNLKYWERGDYLGLGLGAASMVRNIRMKNVSDMKVYLEKCAVPKTMREDVQFLEEPRQIEEFMFLGLRKRKGISVKEFKRVFGRDIDLVYEKALTRHLENKMLERKKDRIYLTEEGILVSNAILSDFLFQQEEAEE